MTDTQSSTELLPCPWCAERPRLDQRQTQSLWSRNEVTFSLVICDECEVSGKDFCDDPDGEEAIKWWNSRAKLAEQQDEPVELPRVLSLQDDRCPRHPLIADGFRSGADWMRREIASLGPLYRRPAAQAVRTEEQERAAFEAWYTEYTAIGWSVSRAACYQAWMDRARLNGIKP